jgi:hypothetical protein
MSQENVEIATTTMQSTAMALSCLMVAMRPQGRTVAQHFGEWSEALEAAGLSEGAA